MGENECHAVSPRSFNLYICIKHPLFYWIFALWTHTLYCTCMQEKDCLSAGFLTTQNSGFSVRTALTVLCAFTCIVELSEDIREHSFSAPPVTSLLLGTQSRSGQVITTHPLAPHISLAANATFQFSRKWNFGYDIILAPRPACCSYSIVIWVVGGRIAQSSFDFHFASVGGQKKWEAKKIK